MENILISGKKEEVLRILKLLAEQERFENISSLHGLSDEQLGIKKTKSVDSIVKKYNATHLSIKDFK